MCVGNHEPHIGDPIQLALAGWIKAATEATPHSRTHRDKISQGLVGSFNSTS